VEGRHPRSRKCDRASHQADDHGTGPEIVPRFSLRFIRIDSYAEPSLDKRSISHGQTVSLMVTSIALRYATLVARNVGRFLWPQRPKADRHQKVSLNGPHNAAGSLAFEQRQRKTFDCENLIWTQRGVVDARPMIAAKDVEEAAGRFVPKSGLKARFALLKNLLPPAREKTADPQFVEPESLHWIRISWASSSRPVDIHKPRSAMNASRLQPPIMVFPSLA
jgi:hypothetical protein